MCGGLYAAAHQSYRFAAADTASAHFRAKAVSWVLAGGIFAGVIGPQLVILTKDAWPRYLFAGTYLAQSACALLAAVVLVFLKSRSRLRCAASPPGGRSARSCASRASS